MVIAHSVQNPVFELMVEHLEQVAVELFADYGISARADVTSTPWFELGGAPSSLAVIGFVSEGARGALVLITLESTVMMWLNAMGETSTDPADALGEFANMLLGRLKARLLPVGLPLRVSTPTTASGNGLRLSTPPAPSKWLVLCGDDWELKVRLDTTFDAHFALRETNATETPAQAGDAIFF